MRRALPEMMGADLPAHATVAKDYTIQVGIPFSTIKAALELEANKTR